MKGLIDTQKNLWGSASSSLKIRDAAHLKEHHITFTCSVGEWVLIDVPNKASKLDLNRKGPFKVVEVDGNHVTYHDTNLGKAVKVHKSRFVGNPSDIEAANIAARDRKLFIPEEVLNHRYRKGNLEFLVHWLGYPSEEDTWEPYAANKNNLIFREYHSKLEENKKKK